MARILLGSNSFTGHVRPGLPIARELVRRGHEVVWYTGSAFRAAVQQVGARHAAAHLAPDFDEADLEATFPGRSAVRPGLAQLKFDIRHVFIDALEPQLQDLRRLHDAERFDAVVVESTFSAGAFLAEEHGLPWAAYGITPLTGFSLDTAPTGLGLLPMAGPLGRLRNRTLNALLSRGVFAAEQRHAQAVRDRVGLPPSPTFFFNYAMDRAPLYLQGTIPDFEYPRSDLSSNVHLVGALMPPAPAGAALPDWWDELDGDRPVVLVTQGTVKVDPETLLHPAIEALADQDVLVVATTGGADPDQLLRRHRATNVRLTPFVPFGDLLPHVDVMVSNGGYGGTQQALAHGVPVVAAGITEGKNEVAARLRWSGAGLDLRTDTPSATQVRTAVRTLLEDPAYRTRAHDLAAVYRQHDAAATSADLIEGLLESALGRGVVHAAAERAGRLTTG